MGNPALSLPVILSPTRVELGNRCERRHILSDLAHRQGKKSPSAAFGDHIHAGAYAWWAGLEEGKSPLERLEAAREALTDVWSPAANGGYHSLDLALSMMEGYAEKASLAAASSLPGWRIFDLEKRLYRHLGHGPYVLSFKLDRALIRDADEHGPAGLLIVDTKTSARPDEKWAASLRRSIQQRCYNHLLEEHYGLPILEHWVEGLDKKVLSRAPVYERLDTFWTPAYKEEAIRLAAYSGQRDHAAIQQALGHGDPEEGLLRYALEVAPFNYQDCHSYYFPCPFLEVCDADPGERLVLVGDMEVDEEPWQTEVRAALEADGTGTGTLP